MDTRPPRTDEIRVIREITERIGASFELDRILAMSLEALETSLGFKHSMILLAEPGADALKVAASRGYADPGIGAAVPLGQGVLGIVARRRRITRLGNLGAQRSYMANVRRQVAGSDAAAQLAAIPDLPGLPDAESQIGIPLLVNEGLIGVLGVESRSPRAFDELDEMLLSIIASQLAHAIENARLHAAAVELAEMRRERDLREELLRRMAPAAVIPLMLDQRLTARHLNISILFADIEGFTAHASGMEPDEMFAHINHFFSWAGEVIERYRGYVNKTSGDGLMALFGVPFESGTHQTDAVLAALALQSELREMSPFKLRIGVNSGTVSAGMLGPRNKSVYDVVGDAVNVASRMEALCPTGGVVVSETADALRPYFVLESLGELPVKGKGIMSCALVRGLKPILADTRRVDPSSRFAADFAATIDEIEAIKREHLPMIDFPSIQARDAALHHNEAVAAFALGLAREVKGRAAQPLDEETIVLAALLHDVGKHAVDAERLNRPMMSGAEREAIRSDMCRETVAALERLGFARLSGVVTELYRFERTRGADSGFDRTIEVLAACDIYDALVAPKRYKGAPWRIAGALAELLRLPWLQTQDARIFETFIDLMKPKDAEVHGLARARILLR
jgi:adenylate cyclase